MATYAAVPYGVSKSDNSNSKFVVVFLGDLGRDLGANERLHWQSYNVPPEGGISRAAFARS